MCKDNAFEMSTSNIRFGTGVTREVGMDLADLGLKKIMVLTDSYIAQFDLLNEVLKSLESEKIQFSLFDRVRVEPTNYSLEQAIQFAREGEFDGFVAVGGGSTIDTAKVANLYTTYPAPFLDYVNAPIGKGRPVPGRLKPLIAIPTTAGTGSETTGVAIFDLKEIGAKTGIAHRYLKPTLGIVDPRNTATLPPAVAASTGLDVLSHALESYTALPFDTRPRPERPLLRPAYQGSNPISDLWALKALKMVARYLVRAVEEPNDEEARSQMLLASTLAGIGFGNAGVHLPHGMSYPVAGMPVDFVPEGYPGHTPFVPHGISVICNAPAVFRFTAKANPQRHLDAAHELGADTSKARLDDAGHLLSEQIIVFMKKLKIPNGLNGLGFGKEHIPELVKGTLPQHRVTKLSPRPAGEKELSSLFEDALSYW